MKRISESTRKKHRQNSLKYLRDSRGKFKKQKLSKPPLCACGCGQFVNVRHGLKWARYCKNHYDWKNPVHWNPWVKGAANSRRNRTYEEIVGVKKGHEWRNKQRLARLNTSASFKTRQKQSLAASKRSTSNSIKGKAGYYKIGKKKYYFRSSWEPLYAKYLQNLKKQKKIKKWEYEPDTFSFKRIRGPYKSYTPDFKIFNINGSVEYHEVKGYLDDWSKIKLERMAKYYPDVIIQLKELDFFQEHIFRKKIFSIVIEDPVIVSLNVYRTSHWSKWQKIREDQYKRLKKALRCSRSISASTSIKRYKKIPSIKKYPVSIEFILEKPRPFDCSNLVVKHYEDSLIKLGIITDDSPKYVKSIKLVSKSSKKAKLTINIYG